MAAYQCCFWLFSEISMGRMRQLEAMLLLRFFRTPGWAEALPDVAAAQQRGSSTLKQFCCLGCFRSSADRDGPKRSHDVWFVLGKHRRPKLCHVCSRHRRHSHSRVWFKNETYVYTQNMLKHCSSLLYDSKGIVREGSQGQARLPSS